MIEDLELFKMRKNRMSKKECADIEMRELLGLPTELILGKPDTKYKTLLDKYERLLDSYVKLSNIFLERMDDENTL